MTNRSWHNKWINNFPKHITEVKIEIGRRADLLTVNGKVVEFQNSPISTHEIEWRERSGNIIWVFNVGTKCKIISDLGYEGRHVIFQSSVWHFNRCKKDVVLDTGQFLILIRSFFTRNKFCNGLGIGVGVIIKYEEFTNYCLGLESPDLKTSYSANRIGMFSISPQILMSKSEHSRLNIVSAIFGLEKFMESPNDQKIIKKFLERSCELLNSEGFTYGVKALGRLFLCDHSLELSKL